MSPKKIFIFSLLATIVVGFLFFTGTVLAQSDPYGLLTTAQKAGLDKTGPGDLPTLAGNVLGTALSFIGVLFFALMVYGGFIWMTARGNEENTKKALNTITAAVIGLIIVLSSYTITSFVFKSVGVQSGGASTGGSGTGANAECVAFNASFSCNEITSCDGIATTTEFTTIEIKNAQGLCTTNGELKCKTGLCGSDNTKVCCKPKTTTVNWCYVEADKVCKTQSALGSVTCKEGVSGIKYYENSTEVKCYTESLKNMTCASDSDCKNDITKLVCSTSSTTSICIEPSTDGTCTSSKDCKDSICKEGNCTKGTSASVANYTSDAVSFGYCSTFPTDGDICDNDSQCLDGHCVSNKCQSGDRCALCETDSDCDAGYFCNTDSLPSGCMEKRKTGEKCFGKNNGCLSGTCIDKTGFDVCK